MIGSLGGQIFWSIRIDSVSLLGCSLFVSLSPVFPRSSPKRPQSFPELPQSFPRASPELPRASPEVPRALPESRFDECFTHRSGRHSRFDECYAHRRARPADLTNVSHFGGPGRHLSRFGPRVGVGAHLPPSIIPMSVGQTSPPQDRILV